MGLHPQIRMNIELPPDALMETEFIWLTNKAQQVGTHVERLDTRPPNQVSQMGRSGPGNSSKKTVTTPSNLPEGYWNMSIPQRRKIESKLTHANDRAWRKLTRQNENRCVFCGDDRHTYAECNLKPKQKVAAFDFEIQDDSKNESQAEE
jgi:hypothetical protein